MSKDHQKLASASSSGQVTVWETKTGAHTQLFGANSADAKGDNISDDIDDETGGRVENIMSLAFRNSFQLACGGWGTIRIFNTYDGTIAQENYEADESVELMEFSTDGQWLAYKICSGRDRHYSLRCWNTATGKRFSLSVPDPSVMDILSLSFSMDGQMLVSTSWGKFIYLWDVKTGHCIRQLEIHGASGIQASFDAGIERRLNTQFGSLTIEDPGSGCLGPDNLNAKICGYGFSFEPDWLVLDGRRLLWIPPDYRTTIYSRQLTPIINESAIIWISRTGRLVRLYFPPRH
ncbi:hypothetical protein CCUS01_07616 [Colletotrichum cuscutae]|uniref:Mitochondrial division protein 1 n=1 Tax=Colletotrichum cuscutae TaxID=1209917 RepID=A0AAI9UVY2_9PEZI|nr:hypothetical protein CCUS01_07616 [Colletotrichum cuscutae]